MSFAYSASGDNAINHVSFSVKKGQKIGIIGGTGAGKSTLINLIPGFYFPSSGDVYVDGKNTASWNSDELRKKFAIVAQNTSLFSGTIRSNMCFGNENADDETIWSALKAAQAKDFVSEKEDVLDHKVAQNGTNFSGGQTQRLTIARALVRKSEILILDDSSSALDYATEASLRSAIYTLPWNPTVFIVSQRASSVMSADLIIVLDDGNVVGQGKHDELLESCPVYREIFDSQFKKEDVR